MIFGGKVKNYDFSICQYSGAKAILGFFLDV